MFSNTNFPKATVILKALLFWLLFLGLLFAGAPLITSVASGHWNKMLYGLLATFAAITATWILLKIEKQHFVSIGFFWQRQTIIHFCKGLVIGSIIFSIIIILLVSCTDLTLQKTTDSFHVSDAVWYLAILPLALMEEIAFRAYPFIRLQQVFGFRITQIILSVVFALYHILQGWDFQIAFLGPGIWAFVFGLAAWRSGGIALPTGIHVALNIIQPLLGMGGSDEYASLWLLTQPENASENDIAYSDTVGLITQVLVLLSTIFLTEYFLRKRASIKHV